MPLFLRITVEEARALSRDQLLPRIQAEQKYWQRRMDRMQINPDDAEAYKIFSRIMHVVIDPNGASSERGYYTQPLGERGEL